MLEEKKLTEIGIDHYGSVSTSEIVFGEEIREICEGNGCGRYGLSWACPPAVGTLEECERKCHSFENAFVFSGVYPLEDSFDLEGMQNGHREFKHVCDRLYELVKDELPRFLILSNEGCTRCAKCTFPEAECRFPDKLFPSVEGFGIYVNKLALSAGMKYINGVNTVTYFGMLLY